MSKPLKLSLLLLLGATCLVLTFLGGMIFSRSIPPAPSAPPLIFPPRPAGTTPTLSLATLPSSASPAPTRNPPSAPAGKIAYVCQIFKDNTRDQICLINADGTGWHRLTANDNAHHYYPSLSPDGKSVLYASNMDGRYEIYEQDLLTGQITRTYQPGIAPELSPDGKEIAFTLGNGQNDTIWLMNRDGTNPRQIYSPGWDATWSPDGAKILFATLHNNLPQLATIGRDATGFQILTDLPLLRGRSDWSSDGQHIITYSGSPWQRELYLMDANGQNPRQISPSGGNSQGPSLSPDGEWVAFTAYFDLYKNVNGCEIYLMRLDGSALTRLTENTYCDWQPRWGP